MGEGANAGFDETPPVLLPVLKPHPLKGSKGREPDATTPLALWEGNKESTTN